MQSMMAEQQFVCSQSEQAVHPAHVMASGESMHELPLLPLLLAAAPQMGLNPPPPLPLPLLDELLELLPLELLELFPPPEPPVLLLEPPLLVPEPLLLLDEPFALPEPLLPVPPPLLPELPPDDPLPVSPPLLLPEPLEELLGPLPPLPLPDDPVALALPASPPSTVVSPAWSPAWPWAQAHRTPDTTAMETTNRFIGETSFCRELRSARRVQSKAQLRSARREPCHLAPQVS